jgi:hypothetical protein
MQIVWACARVTFSIEYEINMRTSKNSENRDENKNYPYYTNSLTVNTIYKTNHFLTHLPYFEKIK